MWALPHCIITGWGPCWESIISVLLGWLGLPGVHLFSQLLPDSSALSTPMAEKPLPVSGSLVLHSLHFSDLLLFCSPPLRLKQDCFYSSFINELFCCLVANFDFSWHINVTLNKKHKGRFYHIVLIISLFKYSRFATQERNALLLYNGRFNEKHDFIAVEIIEEQIQLTFSAGGFLIPLSVCLFQLPHNISDVCCCISVLNG